MWRDLDVSWSEEYLTEHPWALAISDDDLIFFEVDMIFFSAGFVSLKLMRLS
jgi:hypothetical protein